MSYRHEITNERQALAAGLEKYGQGAGGNRGTGAIAGLNLPPQIRSAYLQDPSLALALQARQTGASTAPVGSWGEGLARMLQAPIGAMQQRQLAGQYQGQATQQQQALAQALAKYGQGDVPGALEATTQSPYLQDFGTNLVMADVQQRQQLELLAAKLAQDGKTTLSPDEVQALGLPPGTVAQRDANGGISVVNKPETAPPRIQEYQQTHPEDPSFQNYDQWLRDNRSAGASRITLQPEQKGNQKAMELGVTRIYEQTDKAQSAVDGIGAIHMARDALDNGAFVGPGGDIKQGVSKFLQFFDVNVAPEAVAATDRFRSGVGQLVLAQIKQLGANPSNADREQLEKIVGTLPTDPNAMRALLDWRENQLRKTIQTHNRAIGAATQSGINFPYSLNIEEPPPYATSAGPSGTPSNGWSVVPVN